jgi:hypothetical protein
MKINYNETTPALRRIPVYLETLLKVPVTGALPVGAQIMVSQSGGGWVNAAGIWFEDGAGLYYYQATQSESTTDSFLMLRVAWPGARVVVFSVDIGFRAVIAEPTPTKRRFPIYLEDQFGNGVPGLSITGAEQQLSKNGALLVNCLGTTTEVGGVGLGLGAYFYEATAAELDTLGYDALYIDKSPAAFQYVYEWNVIIPVTPFGGPGIIIIDLITPISTISKSTPIIIDVYSTAVPLRRAWVNASYAGFLPDDMVHNSDRFGSAYQGSTNVRSNITNGYRFTLLRDGGWPGTPAITVHAVDSLGTTDEP